MLTPDPLRREAPELCLFAKHSDTTLQLLGKSLSLDFITVHNEQHSHTGSNPYNHSRIGLHDHLLNLFPLFNPDWFSQAFINYFGYPCYILTQCGICFSTFLFIREVLTFLLKFYRPISIKYSLQSNISILSSIVHGFFNIVTSEMITDLNNFGKRKRIYTKHKLLHVKLIISCYPKRNTQEIEKILRE